MYNSIQSLRMKYASPFNPMVFSVGQVQAGSALNIIPAVLSFGGTFRIYDREDALRVKAELEKTILETAKTYNCTAESDIFGPTLGLVNDKECSLFAKKIFSESFGEDVMVDHNPLMGGESHSLTGKIWPGTFIMLGVNDKEAGITASGHHECFDAAEESLKLGAAAHICYALEFLKDGPETDDRIYKGDIKEFYQQYSERSLYAFE
jgi:metal-dependent amidase/aminoacylase/carboxypeptidase family protein